MATIDSVPEADRSDQLSRDKHLGLNCNVQYCVHIIKLVYMITHTVSTPGTTKPIQMVRLNGTHYGYQSR